MFNNSVNFQSCQIKVDAQNWQFLISLLLRCDTSCLSITLIQRNIDSVHIAVGISHIESLRN